MYNNTPILRLVCDIFGEMPGVEEKLCLDRLKKLIEYRLNTIDSTNRSRQVLEMLYGLNGQEPQLAWEVARRLNLHEQTVRGHHKKGLRRMRHPIHSKPIRKYIENGLGVSSKPEEDIDTLNHETMREAIKKATGDNKIVVIWCYGGQFMVEVTGEKLKTQGKSASIEEAVISTVNAYYSDHERTDIIW